VTASSGELIYRLFTLRLGWISRREREEREEREAVLLAWGLWGSSQG
jgi:hypothetical protein